MIRNTTGPGHGRRPLDALGDLPGDPGYDLTRAVIVYRQAHQLWEEKPSDRDWGLGLVLDGAYPMAADVVDLGTGRRYLLDLERLVPVVDWVATETLAHVSKLLGLDIAADRVEIGVYTDPELARYCEALGLEVLRRAGVDPLTRAPILRIGFRDIVRDVEIGGEGSIRLAMREGSARIDLDAENLRLCVICTGRGGAELERALSDAFSGLDVRAAGPGEYHVRFSLPTSYIEIEALMRTIRSGVLHLVAFFEPERYRTTLQVTRALGSRGTLHRVFGPPAVRRTDPARLEESA